MTRDEHPVFHPTFKKKKGKEQHMSGMDEVTKEKLMDDLRVVMADAEALIKATAGQAGEQIAVARARAEESLKVARERLIEAQAVVVARTKAAARATDEYVHENPWKAVGVAAGLGFVIGLLINRRN